MVVIIQTIDVATAAPYIPYFGISNTFNIRLIMDAINKSVKIHFDLPFIDKRVNNNPEKMEIMLPKESIFNTGVAFI